MFELILSVIAIIILPALAGNIIPHSQLGVIWRWLLGVLLIGLIIVFGHGLGLGEGITFLLVALLVVYGGIKVGQQRQIKLPKLTPYAILLGLVIILLFIITWSDVIAVPMHGGDAVAIWYNKARHIFFWKPFAAIPISTYPNLGASLWAYVMHIAGNLEYVGRLIFPSVAIMWFAGIMQSKLRDGVAKIVILIAATSSFLFLLNSDFWNGYQDILLGTLAAAAVYFLVKALMTESGFSKWELLPGLFFAGCLYMVKNEGIFLAAIIVLGFVIGMLVRHSPRRLWRAARTRSRLLFAALLTLVTPAVLWVITLKLNGLDPSQVQGNAFTLAGVLAIPQKLGTWPDIYAYLKLEIINLLPLLLFAAVITSLTLVLVRSRMLLAANVFMWSVVVIHTVFILFTFLATNADLAWHLDAAFHRLMSQHELIFILIIVINLEAALGEHLRSSAKTWPRLFAKITGVRN